MGYEIERKFLVDREGFFVELNSIHFAPTIVTQGYIHDSLGVVRVRKVIKNSGDSRAFITFKKSITDVTNIEFEYAIPPKDASDLIKEFQLEGTHTINKMRYNIDYAGHTWEVDDFFGDDIGLCIAEIELESEYEPFEKPSWIKEEVTGDKRYRNSYITRHPFNTWQY